MAARDAWIGWSDDERARNLQLIVNNSRFLILPWVRVKGLASMILAACAGQLPADWERLYGYRPLLLETLVDAERFRGTCYRAANWIRLGQTTGRGRMDREHAEQRGAGLEATRARGEPVVRVNLNLCESCLEKQRTIDRQKQEIQSLREKVRRLERKTEQGPFGSSTPSAKIPVKANTAEEQRSKPGGAKPGHTGHGRQAVEYRDRSVIDSQPLRAERILYQLERARCPRCGKTVQARAPEVLPKSLHGNQLITQVVFLHYRQGISMGRLCDQLGIGLGAVFDILHRMAALFRGVIPKLIGEYRQAPVRHADETGWRTDGRSGYAWLFASTTVSLFLFRSTRSAQAPKEVLGEQALSGVVVVDRYIAYNRAPCALQYCYAHLLRDVEHLAKEFPGEAEVTAFTSTLIPLLAEAMHLRGRPLADAEYYAQARPLQQQIVDLVEQPAQHLGVRQVQGIFRDNVHRLYHWVQNRAVPADNNRAERELRPTVIARKVSFGSQSDAGTITREVLMSVVHTLAKRVADPEAHFKSVLDQLAADPTQDPVALLLNPG